MIYKCYEYTDDIEAVKPYNISAPYISSAQHTQIIIYTQRTHYLTQGNFLFKLASRKRISLIQRKKTFSYFQDKCPLLKKVNIFLKLATVLTCVNKHQ